MDHIFWYVVFYMVCTVHILAAIWIIYDRAVHVIFGMLCTCNFLTCSLVSYALKHVFYMCLKSYMDPCSFYFDFVRISLKIYSNYVWKDAWTRATFISTQRVVLEIHGPHMFERMLRHSQLLFRLSGSFFKYVS